jgi:AcrR family transcriptional regulator
MTASATAVRGRLDRRAVLEAALALVDREGLDAVTMRRLGAELDVDPMTAHHHVESKEGLLDGIAELLWEEVALPQGQIDPVETLRTLAESVRDLFRRHPQAAPLVLRCASLPRSQLELYRAYLDALLTEGIPDPVSVLRSILTYALGYGSAEVSMLGVQCGPDRSRALSAQELLLYLGQSLPPATAPELASAAVAMIAECDADRCFEDGLSFMLAGLAGSSDPSRKGGRRSRA